MRVCTRCGRPVQEFHGDAVWRDEDGYMFCNRQPDSTEPHTV